MSDFAYFQEQDSEQFSFFKIPKSVLRSKNPVWSDAGQGGAFQKEWMGRRRRKCLYSFYH